MSRIENIKRYAMERDEKIKADGIKKQQELEEYVEQIKALGPRIKELIDVANACLEYGVEINGQGRSHSQYSNEWENKTFCTNCITHKIGFVWQSKDGKFINRIEEMGINGGGACGEHYLRTNGDYIVSRIGYGEQAKYKEPNEYQLKGFVKNFDAFETAFYKYVDNLLPSIKKEAEPEEEQGGMTIM